jgi:hypothetical protein
VTATDVVVTTDITPSDWYINPRTGWPWPGVIARREHDDGMALVRQRAAREIRALRFELAYNRTHRHDDSLVNTITDARLAEVRIAISRIRSIFRPAPRAGRPDLAGLLGGRSERRDGDAQREAPDLDQATSPGPAAVRVHGGRDLTPP